MQFTSIEINFDGLQTDYILVIDGVFQQIRRNFTESIVMHLVAINPT